MTRAQTVVLALLIMHYLLGGLCLAAARSERPSAALRLWGWGLLIYATGLAITLVRVVPLPLSLTLGNALIAWAPIITVAGVLANTPVRLKPRWTYPVLAVTIIALAWNNFSADPRTMVNLVAPSVLAVALFGVGAYWLLRLPPPAAVLAARFMAITMLVALWVWVLRIAFIWNISRVTNDRDSVDLVISLFAIVQMVVAVACTMALFWIEVRKAELTLIQAALTDTLTGVPNRRAVLERFNEMESLAVRHGHPFGLLILDIDHFKQFNDRYGHLTGDRVLRHVADTLARGRRAGDFLGRVGGEEFVVLINGDQAIAMAAADRLRMQIQENTLDCDGQMLSLTVSGGLAMFPADGVDWDKLFGEADRRLYASKHGGRNRITAKNA